MPFNVVHLFPIPPMGVLVGEATPKVPTVSPTGLAQAGPLVANATELLSNAAHVRQLNHICIPNIKNLGEPQTLIVAHRAAWLRRTWLDVKGRVQISYLKPLTKTDPDNPNLRFYATPNDGLFQAAVSEQNRTDFVTYVRNQNPDFVLNPGYVATTFCMVGVQIWAKVGSEDKVIDALWADYTRGQSEDRLSSEQAEAAMAVVQMGAVLSGKGRNATGLLRYFDRLRWEAIQRFSELTDFGREVNADLGANLKTFGKYQIRQMLTDAPNYSLKI